MRPKFALAVDRVFAQVLDLLSRIDRGETVAPEEERARVQSLLSRAENEIGQGKEWELSKKALIYWADEVLIAASWEGCIWWNEHKLETEYFGTNDRAWLFYRNAEAAASAEVKRRDALEVYYIAVVLGFRGIYADGDPLRLEKLVRQHGFRHVTLEEWLRDTAKRITLGGDRPPLDPTPSTPGLDAAPREGESLLISWALLGLVLAAATAALAAVTYRQWLPTMFFK
jgi:type VI secretion system protein ImpK